MLRHSVFLFCAMTIACSPLRLRRDENGAPPEASRTIKLNTFLWGFVAGQKLSPISELCPQAPLQSLEMKMGTSDVLLALVTLGIYVPYQLELNCSKPGP